MKVALVGNMNNNFFALGKFLRDRKHDVTLFYGDHNFDHFDPWADSHDLHFQQWTRRRSWGQVYEFHKADFSSISKELRGFDLISCSGSSLAALEKANIHSHIYTPYGYDLWKENRYLRRMRPDKSKSVLQSAYWMRKALKSIPVVHMPKSISAYENRLRKLAPQTNRWDFGFPVFYHTNYLDIKKGEWPYHTHWRNEFLAFRNQSDFLVFAPSRHVWDNSPQSHSAPSSKGNNLVIEAWKIFLEESQSNNPKLVFLEYGSNVEKSKKKVFELNLQDSIHWLPRMYRKDLVCGYIQADAVMGEFTHSWSTGGVMNEALAIGKPLITKYDFENASEVTPPLYKANSVNEIVKQLLDVESNINQVEIFAKKSRNWYEKTCVEKTLNSYEELAKVV